MGSASGRGATPPGTFPATATGPSCRLLDKVPSASRRSETRKEMNYSRAQRSRGKLWWKLVFILTCNSFVGVWCRGERLIESPGSWFPSKFPSGKLKPK
jgi:hypothetical protein